MLKTKARQPLLDFGDRETARGRFGDLHEEIVVDNFAGGGGASMGIEEALGRSVDIAINHDRAAVEIHAMNHPATRHLCEDVWSVDPVRATAGRPVGLAWFSPDCKHFSRAKGGKPVEKKIRGLAWVVVRWAKAVKPRVIILENVREFETWGPLNDDNMPCPRRKGLTFKRWVGHLRGLGYQVEWKTLNAADYGAPTHRRRLFLIARCDGQPIVWPEPTHGPGRPKPWRTAAECIDWSIPCPSIFLTKEEGRAIGVIRPLAEKTQRRIAMGLKRYVLDNPKPFIVTCNHGGPEFRGQAVEEPMSTVTGSRDAHGLVTPFLAQRNGEAPHQQTRGQDVDRPLNTITPREGGGFSVVAPYVAGYGGRAAQSPATGGDAPVGTITAKNDRVLVAPYMTRIGNYGGNGAYSSDAQEPLRTIVSENQDLLVAPILSEYHNEKSPGDLRAKGLEEPLPTQTTENRFALAAAFVNRHFGGQRPPVGSDLNEPLRTVTAIDHHSITAANLMKFRGDSEGSSADAPVPTITAGGDCERPAGAAHALGLQVANLVHFNHGEKQWTSADEPMRTVCTGGNHAAVVAFLLKYYGTSIGQYLSDALHCITGNDRFALVHVDGLPYAIADIGMRMLRPRELARAQGFPDSYVLKGSNALQVKMIGNSVAPVMGKVLVAANFRSQKVAKRKAAR